MFCHVIHAAEESNNLDPASTIPSPAKQYHAIKLQLLHNIDMTTPIRDGFNPLRPYYIPPSIGDQTETLPGQPNPFSHANATSNTKYASRARDIFPDLDYRDFVNDPSPSTIQTVKELLDELLWKYTSVLMAQPFEVAKTVLQVRTQDDLELLETGTSSSQGARPKILSPKPSGYDQVS